MVNALGPLFTFKQGSIIDVSLYPKHTSNVHKYLAVKYLLKVINKTSNLCALNQSQK